MTTDETALQKRKRGGGMTKRDVNGKLPEEHTPEDRKAVFAAVFEGMAQGRTVSETARLLGLNPGSVRMWLSRDEESWERYQRMKSILGAALAERALDVAEATTNATSAADRLRVETLRWLASKVNPVEYGDRQVMEHQGQQTLQVKVVEEDKPVRNQEALSAGLSMVSVAAQVVSNRETE